MSNDNDLQVGKGLDIGTANLAAALTADAELPEALELSNTAASVVIHKLGTTGTASVEELRTWQGHAVRAPTTASGLIG